MFAPRHLAALVVAVLTFGGLADAQQPASAPAPVTLQGSLLCDGACLPSPKTEDHTMVLYAIDGTPAVRAEVAKMVEEFFPEQGLDADAAEKLMGQFTARSKYYLAPESPALKSAGNKGQGHYCLPAAASAVTGTLSEHDGRKWILATKIEPAQLKYPAKMLTADKPFAKPPGEPLVLKIDEKLSLKCIAIPPGRFFMGTPVYMWPYYVEEYPHQVKLTRAIYMAEIPITQEIYEAVMGANPSTVKDPQLPVQDPKFADIQAFCDKLSQRTGRKVRLPTDAEWEYAARVGTSNPAFPQKYAEQNSSGPNGFKSPLRVKSRQPNAWGLYDMASCWWEITADRGMYNVRKSEVDPAYPPDANNPRAQRSGRGIVKDNWSLGTHEFITEKGYAGQKFRIVVVAGEAATRP